MLFGADFNFTVFRLQTLFGLLMLKLAADMFKWTHFVVVVVVKLLYVSVIMNIDVLPQSPFHEEFFPTNFTFVFFWVLMGFQMGFVLPTLTKR